MMNSHLARSLFRAAAALLLFGASIHCQDDARRQVRSMIDSGQLAEAHERVGAVIAREPNSCDWLFLQSYCLARMGEVRKAEAIMQELMRQQAEQRRELEAAISDRRGGVALPALSGGPSAGGSKPSTEEGAPKPGGANSGARTPGEHSAGPALHAAAEVVRRKLDQLAIVEADLDSKDAKVRDNASARLPDAVADLVREGDARQEAGDSDAANRCYKAACETARRRPEVQASTRTAVLPGMGKLLDALASEALALLAAGKRSEAESRAADASKTIEMLIELGDQRAALMGLRRLVATQLTDAADVLHTMARSFEQWAAAIEDIDAGDEQRWAKERRLLLEVASNLYAVPSCRDQVEDGVIRLRNSHHQSIVDAARELLDQWAEGHAARGKALQAEDRLAAAAPELERAHICNPELVAAAIDAATIYAANGQEAKAAAIVKPLLTASDDQVAARSRQLWQRLLEKSKAAGPAMMDRVDLLTDAETWQELRQTIERELPVIPKAELDLVADLVAKGNSKQARLSLRDVLRNLLAADADRTAEALADRATPRVGSDFLLPGGKLSAAWYSDPSTGEGFWGSRVRVDRQLWHAVFGPHPVVFDREGAYLNESWDSWTRFCTLLTEQERTARRLPADHAYSLPTSAQLDRMRDGQGRLPGTSGQWIWTNELSTESDMIAGQPRMRPFAVSVDSDEKRTFSPWQPVPPEYQVGFLVVLTRQPSTP